MASKSEGMHERTVRDVNSEQFLDAHRRIGVKHKNLRPTLMVGGTVALLLFGALASGIGRSSSHATSDGGSSDSSSLSNVSAHQVAASAPASQNAARSLPPILEQAVVAEDDFACPDKTSAQAATQLPLRWVSKPVGRRGIEVNIFAAFFDLQQQPFGKSCELRWSGDEIGILQRERDLVCVEILRRQRTGRCYWMSTRLPSERAGPKPVGALDGKPQSAIEPARSQILDALGELEETPAYKSKSWQQRRQDRLAVLRKAAGPDADASEPYLRMGCSGDEAGTCEMNMAAFQKDYVLALRGDYLAQQNVAACLQSPSKYSCPGVVENTQMSCVWQIVMLASGDSRVSRSDIVGYQRGCAAGRTSTEAAVNHAQADALFQRIYRRPLPQGF
jgi:hypothetical protein